MIGPAVDSREAPYLSVVVTTRNDDHGGDPLKRLQAFVNAFDAQCRRTKLEAEVIVVEWNPPTERPRLHELVRLPERSALVLRFVEVPATLHGRIRHADVLPLFQMIAKNVGIRRARGRFILATNIDIIFSDELVEYFASGQLAPGYLYRVDRHDIQSDFPVDSSLEKQMAYCRTHQLRLHARDGTYHVNRFGRVTPLEQDIVDPPVVTLGAGWHVREGNTVFGFYRWAGDEAHLVVDRAASPGLDRSVVLGVDLEPNPYQPGSWIDVEILDRGRRLVRRRISRVASNVTRLNVALEDNVSHHEITLRVVASSGGREHLPLFERRERLLYRLYRATVRAVPTIARSLHDYDIGGWRRGLPTSALSVDRETAAVRVVTDPGIFSYGAKFGPLQVPRDGVYDFVLRCSCSEGEIAFAVMDGTRGEWLQAEDLEIHEDMVSIRTVSVELTRGQKVWLFVSNNHPDGDRASHAVIHSLRGSVPLHEFRVRLDPVAVRRSIRGRFGRGAQACSRFLRLARDSAVHRTRQLDGAIRKRPPTPPVVAVRADVSGAVTELSSFGDFLRGHRPAHVHQNACGDFQLMARDRWFELRGYPEFSMYSMNIDGLFEMVAYSAGIKECHWEMPLCIYHLEHEKGSGWTPEGEALLKRRIAESGITWLDASTVHVWSAYMEWLRRPMIFNGSDWGFGDVVLRETTPQTVADNL